MDGPWHIDIRPWAGHVAGSPASPNRAQDVARIGGGVIYDWPQGATPGDYMAWDVPLTAGTWTLTVICGTASTIGTITAMLDATTVGTMDCYSAAPLFNVVKTISGITVSADAVYRLSLNMLTKNASSGGYYYEFQHIALSRTA